MIFCGWWYSDGYEIERQIHGPHRHYNDISRWNHQLLLSTFSPSSDGNSYPSNASPVDVAKLQNHKSYRVSTQGELDKLLNDKEFASANVIQLVELVLPRVRLPFTMSCFGRPILTIFVTFLIRIGRRPPRSRIPSQTLSSGQRTALSSKSHSALNLTWDFH